MARIIDREALEAGFASARESQAHLLHDTASVGVQARMIPVFEAFTRCMFEERERGTDHGEIGLGVASLLATLIQNAALNIGNCRCSHCEADHSRALAEVMLSLLESRRNGSAKMAIETLSEIPTVEGGRS